MPKGQFRHAAGFGKRIEYSIIAEMLKEDMDVYVPLVDDNGIDPREGVDSPTAVPMKWVMSSQEFLDESYENKKGKNKGSHTIWFNGRRKGVSYAKPKFDKYRVERLCDRILGEIPS